MKKAADELTKWETFKGYGPFHGYDFLKEKILDNDYKNFNFSKDEIYISNGTKTDSTSILELFDPSAKVCMTNPTYPVYRDGALALNRNIYYLDLNEENMFCAEIPSEHYDIIYICSPNNPIGTSYSYNQLENWVKYALDNDAIILYDTVYEAFIRTKDTPHSIYEIKDADKVAIEFRSYSKNASFTGIRCSYYVIPNKISKDINTLWKKRTINRFNGVSYITQRGAEAIYTEESQKIIKENINYYMSNASFLKEALINLGYQVWGGEDSPFMWVKTKNNLSSWECFYLFLEKMNIIIIPGIIFGDKGEGYFRVSALAPKEIIEEAIRRIEIYEKEN